MKIPNKIKIGIHEYKVILDPYLQGDEGNYGQINYRTQEIKIWADAPPSLKVQSLIHEVIHLSQHIYRVEISDADIDRIAEVVADFMVNNLGIELDWGDIDKS